MNGYTKLLKIMREQSKKGEEANYMFAKITSSTRCKIGSIELDKDYLLFNEQTLGNLKKGDMVLLLQLSNNKFVVMAKVVSV